jgi:hypothetical protein
MVWPSSRDRSHFVSGLPTDTVAFTPHPGVDLTDIYAFLDRYAVDDAEAAQGSRRSGRATSTPAAERPRG